MSPSARTEMDGLRNIVAEVLVQAARDYRKLRGVSLPRLSLTGPRLLLRWSLSV